MKKILFTGGGSAGHVLPNVALIEEILSAGDADVCYIGTDGIEKKLIAEWKIPYYPIDCPKLVRGGGWKGFKRNLTIPTRFLRAVKQAKAGLQKFQPDVVFSKGGYVALPVVTACKKLKIPCYAHESDLSAGLANKISARFCKKVFTSFPDTASRFKNGEYSGAPIRRAILTATKAEARKAFDVPFERCVLLVFGGGSGSKTINDAVRENIRELTKDFFVFHICGAGNVVQSTLKNYRQFEFVADMGGAYACADYVLSRAGAGTVFEILALKKPALLIPLAGQTRGDQAENAAYFKKRGLCHVLKQNRLDELVTALQNLRLDDGLKARLQECDFPAGNAKLLRALYAETAGEKDENGKKRV